MNLPEPKKSLTPSLWVEPRAGGLSAMDTLFNRFDGMYPNRWRAAFANEQAIANWREAWAIAFADEGLTMEDIAIGVKACRTAYDWPPSLTEFLRVCRVVVDPETAFYEAVRQTANRRNGVPDTWTHPAIYWAVVEFGTFDLQAGAYDRCKARWKGILADKLASPCPAVPVPMLALPTPGETTPDAEAVERLLAGAKAALKKMPV